jgi:uncharacterized protein (TIGR02246 family)
MARKLNSAFACPVIAVTVAVWLAVPSARAGQSKAGEERKGDREAVAGLVQEFVKSFNKGDAKAIAALFTQECEYYDDNTGETFRGRPAVERAYVQLFKAKPGGKFEVQSQSIRFVGRDTALDEGVARLQPAGAELPSSARYSCVCVREEGQWKVALAREWGADEDKLEDLAWLLGDWVATAKDLEVHTSFRWNNKKTMIVGETTVKKQGQVSSSLRQRIGLDPQTRQIRSWSVDKDGGRGQAHWVREGNSWLMDAEGTLPGGAATSAVNILTRNGPDAFTWRSVDRRIGGEEMPPTTPLKITRVKSGN